MRLLRNLLPGLLLAGLLSTTAAQLPAPVDGSRGSVNVGRAAVRPKKRVPVIVAKWPFKFGKKLFGKDVTDPFLTGTSGPQPLGQPGAEPNNMARAVQPGYLIPPGTSRWATSPGSSSNYGVPVGASATTTWQSAEGAAQVAAQLPSREKQSPATPAVATSVVATPAAATSAVATSAKRRSADGGTPPPSASPKRASPEPEPPMNGKRFSHFAASSANNPPPAAIPIKTDPPMETPTVASRIGAPFTASSANVSASALVPDDRIAIPTSPAPQFVPQANRSATLPSTVRAPTVVPPATSPTTLAAGPPSKPPADRRSGPPSHTGRAATAGEFSVDKIDQDIWGPSLAKRPPASVATAAPSRSNDMGAAGRVRAKNEFVSPATNPVSRDGDFVPMGNDQQAVNTSYVQSAPARPIQSPMSAQALAPSDRGLSPSRSPATTPFVNGPSVALESPVLQIEPVEPPNTVAHGTLDEGTRVLAIVGDQSILAGDVLGQVNEMLAPYRGQAPEEELAIQRERIIQDMLPRLVERKLVFYDFINQIPIEKLPDLEQEVFKHFNEKRLPEILKNTNLNSAAELDAKLRLLGSSLANQQRLFFEQMVAAEAVQREARRNDEVSHGEMLTYYNEHVDDYSFPSKVRWERLAVNPSRFPVREQAYNTLARMGNEVFHGANLADVARRSSHGPRSSEGGQYDWTTQGSLVNKEVDRLLFLMPVGELGKIADSDGMFHILRVIERVEAGKKPFTAVQSEIVEMIKKNRFEKRVKAYVSRLRDETYVWTAADGDVPMQTAQPSADALVR
jgi:hypothetical protein